MQVEKMEQNDKCTPGSFEGQAEPSPWSLLASIGMGKAEEIETPVGKIDGGVAPRMSWKGSEGKEVSWKVVEII